MITVRLPEELGREVARIASSENRTKTEIVRDALNEYIEHHQPQGTPYELGKDLFGNHGSGDGHRSRTYKDRLKEKIRATHAP